jgi:hypothetical protein
MANQHMAQGMVIHSVIEGKGNATRIPKDTIDAFLYETFQEHFGSRGQITHNCSSHVLFPKMKKATVPGYSPRRWPLKLTETHSGGAGNDDPNNNAYADYTEKA